MRTCLWTVSPQNLWTGPFTTPRPAGVKFAAVAVRHPSAVLSREQRQRDAGLIAGAAIGPQAAV
jgi:hypothetical protein